jgi:transposase
MARGQRDLGLERQWRERMAIGEASGLSVREFCQRRGLTEPTFHYWRRELRKRDAAASTAA